MATATQKRKVHRVMHEHKQGSLKSGSGRKVKSRKQAIAIAMSESGQSRRRKPATRRTAARKTATRRTAARKTTGRRTATRRTARRRPGRRPLAGRQTGGSLPAKGPSQAEADLAPARSAGRRFCEPAAIARRRPALEPRREALRGLIVPPGAETGGDIGVFEYFA